MINKKNGENNTIGDFTHNGEKVYIWDLPEIPEVYKSVWGGSTETIFTIHTKSMTPFVVDILPENIVDIAIIQALVRPGPLDFIDTKTGRSMAEEDRIRLTSVGVDIGSSTSHLILSSDAQTVRIIETFLLTARIRPQRDMESLPIM